MVAGPSLRGKPRGTLDVVYTRSATHAAGRFENVQGALLRGELALSDPSVRLAASLVAFDGVVTRANLIDGLSACRSAYVWNNAVCIDWEASCGRIDRRHLSVWTRFALAQPDALSLSPGQAIETLDRGLQERAHDRRFSPDFDAFLQDGQAWLSFHLAGPWFAHSMDAVRLAALPRSVFARDVAGKALDQSADGKKREPDCLAETAIGLALDTYLSGNIADGGYWLVDEVMASCPVNATRPAMVKNLLSIAAKDGGGTTSSLILAWATDLAESGTPGDSDISPRTVSKYVRAIARDLLDEFRGKSLEQMESKDFDSAYLRIIGSKSTGTRQNCASALSSWHYFLECWLDVAPRTRSLHHNLPKPVPRANILWPHEVATIGEWLALAERESRLTSQTRVAFAIASTIRIRTNELVKLRVRNVRVIDNTVEIEICTSVTDGGLKSSNARRSQKVECQETAVLVRSWKQRRLEELAMPSDYLFGDPHRPGKPYCLGQMQLLMNRLVKDATGDASVNIHTLSHSWATQKFLDASLRTSTVDINVFDALSEEAGHGDSSMTFPNYVHRFEEPIRIGIDMSIASRIRWPEIAPFVKISHVSYRQRLSRQARSAANIDDGQYKLDCIRAALPTIDLPAVDYGINTTTAMTSALRPCKSNMSLGMIIDVLTDVRSGLSTNLIALRASRGCEDIVSIVHQTQEVLVKLGQFHPANKADGLLDSTDELRVALDHAAFGRIDFARITQKKLLTLRKILASRGDDPCVRNATRSWLQCYRHGYVSLARPSYAAALVKLLRKAEIPGSAIGVFHIPVSDSVGGRLQQEIDAVFVQEFAVMPLKKECTARGGRPSAYVAISGTDFTNNASSATLCMKGFNALLLAACVLERLSSQTQNP